jgi:hypothetical protein
MSRSLENAQMASAGPNDAAPLTPRVSAPSIDTLALRWDDQDAVRDRRSNNRVRAGPPHLAPDARCAEPDSTAYAPLINLARTDPFAASRLGVGAFASLQRAIGNRAVAALILRDSRPPPRHKPPQRHKSDDRPPFFDKRKHDPRRIGSASEETPTTLENTIVGKIRDWRAAADRGVGRFATGAIEQAINNKDVDANALATGLAGNVMWALTAFTSKAAGSANFAVSLAGILIASSPSARGEHDDRTPIAQTRRAIDHILDELQDRHNQYARKMLNNAMYDLPWLSVDDVVDSVLRDIFDERALLVHAGGQTGINTKVVEDEIQAKATDLYKRFVAEVNPIGQGVWGHAKYVLIQIRGGRYNGRQALAERKLSDDGRRDTYWWKHWIDDDLRAAAEARTRATDDSLTIVDEKNVDNINDVGNLAWPRAEPKR